MSKEEQRELNNCSLTYLLHLLPSFLFYFSAASPGQYITLNITSIQTECSYDHVYVYDGNTYESLMLGVFSGRTIPPLVTAKSGSMLILLYSDTNYALEGFVAEYSVTGM